MAHPTEDTPCTACDDGTVHFMANTPHGPSDDARVCAECDGTGSGFAQWSKGYGPWADTSPNTLSN